MGATTDLTDTVQRVVDTKELFDLFQFSPLQEQLKLFRYLQAKDSELCKNLDSIKRTIFL